MPKAGNGHKFNIQGRAILYIKANTLRREKDTSCAYFESCKIFLKKLRF